VSRTSGPAFSAWLDDFFASYFRRRPVNATFSGMHEYDHLLPDLSESGMGAVLADAETLLGRLSALPDEPLSSTEVLDRQLSEGFLRIQRWESGSPHFGRGNPSLFTGEALFGVIGLLLQGRSAVERLAAVPALLHDARTTLQASPRAWIERARRECSGGRVLLDRLPGAAVASEAFGQFDAWLESELLPRATDDYACGEEAFALLLRDGHFLEVSAEELERQALERLAEEEAYLAQNAPPDENLALTPALSQRERKGSSPLPLGEVDAAASGEGGAAARSGGYLERFAVLWQQARQLAEEHELLTFPDWPVRYVEKPQWAREAAPYLYFLPYRSPPPLDPPAVVDYFAPAGADDATIKLNHVVHHGSLGHHVQNWHAARAESRIGQIAAVDCAARLGMLCGGTMAEGWACYSTDLAAEMGFLTPAELYAQHHTQLRVAVRAVVDVRLHQGRCSLAEAAAFYVERVGMSTAAAHAEAVKNSLFPATACMYLAGWEAIRRLRRELSGPSAREFHDRFLSFGSVPVALVARAMPERSPAAAHP
jgi:hypothetical protein